jgi:hypothetical protein
VAVQFNRRVILSSGISAAMLARIPSILAQETDPLEALALEIVSTRRDLINPETVGSLDDAVRHSLNAFVGAIASIWDFQIDAAASALFNGHLGLKTLFTPSYLSEYRGAATLIDAASKDFGDPEAATMFLLFAAFPDKPLLGTRMGHAREWAFQELVTYIVAKAGFKRFGLVNYAGYIGGPYMSESSYRRYVE